VTEPTLKQPVIKQHGLVIKTHSGFYTVQTEQAKYICQLRGRLKDQSKRTELCVIGDRVTFEVNADGSGAIEAVEPRERVLSRVEPSNFAGTSTEREQIIIANPDQAIFVFAVANPEPHVRLLDRFLIAAEKASIPSICICANKVDLIGEEAARVLFATYEKIGYPIIYASAQQNVGIETLRERLHDKISVFTGPSGVGKSSLLNAIEPGLARAVKSVSLATTKGRHTTVNSELIPVIGGGYVADTPGIRSLGLWDIEPGELDAYFVEIHPHVVECRFSDCTHVDEPGCGVRSAVERGEISPERYESYLRLRAELEKQYIY